MLIGIAAYWFIVDWPQKSTFLAPDEKAFVTARLKADSDASNSEQFEWSEVWKAFKDPKVWLYCAHFHTLSLPLYTLSLFLVSHYIYISKSTSIAAEANDITTALDHQELRLYSFLCPAPHYSSLRSGNYAHRHLRHYRREVPPQKRLHHDLIAHGHNRLHNSACQRTSHSPSCRKLCRHLLRRSRHLPFHSFSPVASSHQRIWPDEASYGDGYANHYRQSGRNIRHPVVQN